jgi:uncharacterized protein
VSSGEYLPPALLRNPHLQSVLASSRLRRLNRRLGQLGEGQTEQILDCGQGVRLLGLHTPQRVLAEARGLVVLLHGWEGSVQSSYMLHTGVRLLSDGFDVFRLNFRDHGGTHRLNPELFHSCRIDEVVGALGAIADRFPVRPLAVAGYSLGGNFALRLALRAPAVGIPLSHAVAVCPVISPRAGLAALESAPWFYHAYFMRKWRGSLLRKQHAFPGRFRFSRAELGGSMRELTRLLVERHTDFPSLDAYLDGYSVAGDRLAEARVPLSILTAADDPIIPVADFEQLRLPPGASLRIARHGGHCGFLRDLRMRGFAEDFVSQALLGVA